MTSFSLKAFAALGALALVVCAPSGVRADAKLYNETIVVPADASPDLKAAAEDALATLKTMTGQEFKTSAAPVPAGGIALLRATDAAVPADIAKAVAGANGQAFYLRANESKVQIVATSDSGLIYGLYNYLDRLGARWFLPNDNWTVIPHRTDIRLAVDKFSTPAFVNRSFFATGGFGRAKANRFYDLADEVPNRWARWQTRNGLGAQFSLGGHAGEGFNLRNKAALLAHPEYLAEMGGVRQPWSLGAKPDVSNPGLVDLYVNDRVNQFASQLAKWPGLFAISVDSADGGGYCNSGGCLTVGNGSVSDQVYYLANQVAKAVAKRFPGKYVNLLAYGFYLTPPSFDLEPNVFVTVVPYGFNYSGFTAEEILQKWQEKIEHGPKNPAGFGVYDYWSIPDWSQDLPGMNFTVAPAQKIRSWQAHGVKSFLAESSYSAGTVGLPWYLSSRQLWDPAVQTDALLADFYEKAFGPAAPPMKRMLERWNYGFLLTDHELGCSFRDLAEARTLAKDDPAVLKRLADYERYTHYIRLWYEFWANGSKSEATGPTGTQDALITYMWNIYDSAMVEPHRMTMLATHPFKYTPEIAARYNLSDPNAAFWKNIHQLSDEEVDKNFADDLQKYKPLDFESRGYGGELTPLPAALAVNTNGGKPVDMFFYGETDFQLLVPPGMKSAPLSIAVGAGFDVPFRLVDAAGNAVFEDKVAAMKSQDFVLPFAKPGRYTLQMKGAKILYMVRIPPGLGWTTRYFLNSQGRPAPRLYFYVPKGLKTLAFYLAYQLIPNVHDATGQALTPRIKSAPGICLYDVPPGQDGKVWSFGDLKVPKAISALNFPSAYATSPDQLLVPADALAPSVIENAGSLRPE